MNPRACIADIACFGSIASAMFGWLPTVLASVAAGLACVWYGMEIYDRFTKGKSE